MSIPDFQSLMLPLLEILKDAEEHDKDSVHEALLRYFAFTDEALKKSMPKGDEQVFRESARQAEAHLKMAGLVETTKKGFIRITSLGKQVLGKRLNIIDVQYLRRLPGYLD